MGPIVENLQILGIQWEKKEIYFFEGEGKTAREVSLFSISMENLVQSNRED